MSCLVHGYSVLCMYVILVSKFGIFVVKLLRLLVVFHFY
jgi:hypothetical protein